MMSECPGWVINIAACAVAEAVIIAVLVVCLVAAARTVEEMNKGGG